jgi:hypothetical protein
MNSRERQQVLMMLAAGVFVVTCTPTMHAQVQTDTITTSGQPTIETKVDRGTVVLVDGNDLVVKAEDGHLVHFPNVPESARAIVDGQELGIHDLKPGMMLERTITTTTTPQTITTVKSVTGKVWYVNPPSSVILTLEDGTNQEFKIPQGQKFNIDGQMVDAWGLKKGMRVSATKVVEEPETVAEHQEDVSGTTPPPPPDPVVDLPILVFVITHFDPIPETAPAEVASTELPKTASELPLIGLLGLLSMAAGLSLHAARLRAYAYFEQRRSVRR